jgi:hypothetical protein
MSDGLDGEPPIDLPLSTAFTDPELKLWNLDFNDILTEQELMVVAFLRAARQAVSIFWVVKASGYDEVTVQQALDRLETTEWIKRVGPRYMAV